MMHGQKNIKINNFGVSPNSMMLKSLIVLQHKLMQDNHCHNYV